METKYLKDAARLLNRDYVNRESLDLFKKVLWVSVDQRAAILWAVKVGGQKKIMRSAQRGQSKFEPGRSTELFFDLQL